MTKYSMPVLSEQDKSQLIELCHEVLSSYAEHGGVGSQEYNIYKIALAALTTQPIAFTEKHEISNMHATGLYIRAWPADRERNAVEGYTIPLYAVAPAEVPEKVVKLPMPYTVELKHNEMYFDYSQNGDNYDVSDVNSALNAAGVKYEIKP